jgi:lipoprotein-releasing system permease protein
MPQIKWFNHFEYFLALRYLRAREDKGFVSVMAGFSFLGIALGVATLIVVMSVMNGYEHDMMNYIFGFDGHVQVYGKEGYIDNFKELVPHIKEFPYVKSVVPIIDRETVVMANKSGTGIKIKGLAMEDLLHNSDISKFVTLGNINELIYPGSVMIGEGLAIKFGLRLGDTIRIFVNRAFSSIVGIIPRFKDYNVVAMFRSGMIMYDERLIVMALPAAQLHFGLKDKVTDIEVTLDKYELADKISKEMGLSLGQDYRVENWKLSNRALIDALEIEKVVMFLILTLIILVAGFNIVSSLILFVHIKNKDIAILRTIGASKGNIMRIFLLCGTYIGVAGTFTGLVTGVIFAANIDRIRGFLEKITGTSIFDPVIYYLSHLPSHLECKDILSVGCLALVLSLVATIYPSWKASKLSPVEALRDV